MIKSELTQRLATIYPHFYKQDIEQMMAIVTSAITQAVANQQRVELRGFGVFYSKLRNPRIGRNPRTGERVQVQKKLTLHFRAGKALHERVNRR